MRPSAHLVLETDGNTFTRGLSIKRGLDSGLGESEGLLHGSEANMLVSSAEAGRGIVKARIPPPLIPPHKGEGDDEHGLTFWHLPPLNGLRTIPKGKSLRWSDLRREGMRVG